MLWLERNVALQRKLMRSPSEGMSAAPSGIASVATSVGPSSPSKATSPPGFAASPLGPVYASAGNSSDEPSPTQSTPGIHVDYPTRPSRSRSRRSAPPTPAVRIPAARSPPRSRRRRRPRRRSPSSHLLARCARTMCRRSPASRREAATTSRPTIAASPTSRRCGRSRSRRPTARSRAGTAADDPAARRRGRAPRPCRSSSMLPPMPMSDSWPSALPSSLAQPSRGAPRQPWRHPAEVESAKRRLQPARVESRKRIRPVTAAVAAGRRDVRVLIPPSKSFEPGWAPPALGRFPRARLPAERRRRRYTRQPRGARTRTRVRGPAGAGREHPRVHEGEDCRSDGRPAGAGSDGPRPTRAAGAGGRGAAQPFGAAPQFQPTADPSAATPRGPPSPTICRRAPPSRRRGRKRRRVDRAKNAPGRPRSARRGLHRRGWESRSPRRSARWQPSSRRVASRGPIARLRGCSSTAAPPGNRRGAALLGAAAAAPRRV